jgi:TetR/AcrR family transcriptional regulator, mexJK operon transcriptional repressor
MVFISFIYNPAMEPDGAPRKPKPRATPEAAVPRLEGLIAAAEHVFLSKGYHDATMSAIARQAGMSKRTVYMMVQSKAELFGELLAHRQSRVQFPTPEPGWTLHDTLCANLMCLAKFLLEPTQIAITRLVITEYAHSPDFSRAFLSSRVRKAKSHLETCLLDLALAQGITRPEARELASMLFGMALGEFHFGALSGFRAVPGPKALEARIRLAVTIFLAGLCPEGDATPPSPTCGAAPPRGQ